MNVTPQQEHRWLERLVGDWTFESGYEMPGGEKGTYTGTERVRSIGGIWVVCESEWPTEGEPGKYRRDLVENQSIMTLGYDPVRGKFTGTFIGSMMTHLWVYEGTLDATGQVLALDSEGPSFSAEGEMAEGKMGKYRDIMTFESDDHRVFTSQALGDDGAWHQFMEMHYRRTK